MKKIKAILVSMVLMLSILFLGACGNGASTSDTNQETTSVEQSDDTSQEATEENADESVESEASTDDKEKINLGVHGVHQEIFTFLTEQVNNNTDYEMELHVFDGNSLPAEGLAGGDLDVIIGNHKPWIETFNEENNQDFVMLDDKFAYASEFGIYSKEYTTIEDIPENAQITIGNDPTNRERSLNFLEDLGLLTVGEPSGEFLTLMDIEDNPKNFQFTEVEVTMLGGAYEDADAVLGNTNVMAGAGVEPQSYIQEDGNAGNFPVGLVVHEADQDTEWINAILEQLNSPEFEEKFEEIYQGSQIILTK